ncbi:MAG: FprA family A-type flavoprotein [Clostridia bacterium]|nr:FprA family A-type flavoprotein [Clostridia bacterium]
MNKKEKHDMNIYGVYFSPTGNTEKAVKYLEEKLLEEGCKKVVVCDLAREDMAEAVEDAFRYSKLVLATTTYNGDIFPFMKEFIHHLTERNFSNRTVAFMENGSWAPTAARVMAGMLEKSKNLTFAQTSVKILSALNEESKKQIEDLAKEMAK